MRRAALIATFLVAAVLLPTAAQADCLYKPFDFFPETNGGVVVTALLDAGSTCVHRFKEGPGYTFTGISFGLEPEHGKLVKEGPAYIYTPDKGFTGKDAYMFRICATKGEQKGCAGVAFVVTVR